MPRRNLLPAYLSQQAWVDLCDAIDHVFADRVDTPIENLGKLRQQWLFNDTVLEKIDNAQLIDYSDLDQFETNVLVKQVNLLGYNIRDPRGIPPEVLSRMVQQLALFWYSKGKSSLVDFLGYVFGTEVIMTRMWTQDYVQFYPEGDAAIGDPLWKEGPWYPTTHTTVEIDLLTLPASVSVETFSTVFNDISNYPLVLLYIVSASKIPIHSLSGDYVPMNIGALEMEQQFLANFDLTVDDLTTLNGGGGFTPIEGGSVGETVVWINDVAVPQEWKNNVPSTIPWFKSI